MWSQISWNRGIAYMKMKMMIMMMITTMMALSTIMMIVWNDYCQKNKRFPNLQKGQSRHLSLMTICNIEKG